MQEASHIRLTNIQKKFSFLWIYLIFYINLHNSYKYHMAFSFSFFSEHSPELPLTGHVSENHDEPEIEKADAMPWMAHEEPAPSLFASTEASPYTGGLAALAMQQSTSGPLAPPSRRISSYMTPGPAIAASLALAAQSSADLQPMQNPPQSAPAANHFHAVQSLQSRELAQLRMELESEIQQVRQDLFGAAMGVSALKDRIDGLEGTADSSVSQPQIEQLIRSWLDSHLPSYVEQAVQQTLDKALQQTISTLSSSEFFRMPVHTPGLQSDNLLSQAPQILSTSLT